MINKDKLIENRLKIDEIDKEIAKLLRIRLKISVKIGKLKKKHGVSIRDPNREKSILANLKSPYEKNVFKKILQESRKSQTQGLWKRPNI